MCFPVASDFTNNRLGELSFASGPTPAPVEHDHTPAITRTIFSFMSKSCQVIPALIKKVSAGRDLTNYVPLSTTFPTILPTRPFPLSVEYIEAETGVCPPPPATLR